MNNIIKANYYMKNFIKYIYILLYLYFYDISFKNRIKISLNEKLRVEASPKVARRRVDDHIDAIDDDAGEHMDDLFGVKRSMSDGKQLPQSFIQNKRQREDSNKINDDSSLILPPKENMHFVTANITTIVLGVLMGVSTVTAILVATFAIHRDREFKKLKKNQANNVQYIKLKLDADEMDKIDLSLKSTISTLLLKSGEMFNERKKKESKTTAIELMNFALEDDQEKLKGLTGEELNNINELRKPLVKFLGDLKNQCENLTNKCPDPPAPASGTGSSADPGPGPSSGASSASGSGKASNKSGKKK